MSDNTTPAEQRKAPRRLPPLFVESLRQTGDMAAGLPEALACGDVTVSVRINRAKGVTAATSLECVPWCDSGCYLSRRELFAADPHWHQGLYYVQEASSMAAGAAMAELAARLRADGSGSLCVLDACAAPGGKTIGIAEALTADDIVVANEKDARRGTILLENITKWGRSNIAVTNGDARAFGKLRDTFDIIAADMPCSGEGMMRKEPAAIEQWSPTLVQQCAALQRSIATTLWGALKPGGYMLYSTCTFNTAENEDNIRHLIEECGAESVPLSLENTPGVCPATDAAIHACRFLPGRIRGEGLFLAALRKPRNGCAGYSAQPLSTKRSAKRLAKMLQSVTKVVRYGMVASETRGHDIIPTHQYVCSIGFETSAMPLIDLNLNDTYEYLRGNALTGLPDGTPRGYAVMQYDGHPLGLAKVIDRRANNLYPANMRMRLGPEALAAPLPHIVTHTNR